MCVSGEGTSLQNLINRIRSRRLKAEIVQVVASRPRIGAIARAEAAGIPLALANYNAHSIREFSNSVFEPIRHSKADLVILAGFLALVKIPSDYKGRVINIHPSLIPSFCGKGFYGSKVHKAVLAMGAKITGCTIHFADDAYDNGPIILQRHCARAGRRHDRDAVGPCFQRRVQSTARGHHALRRRPPQAGRPARSSGTSRVKDRSPGRSRRVTRATG